MNRREFLSLGGATAVARAMPLAGRLPTSQPNIILIMADDLGVGDLGYNGQADIATPNIDALAANGLVLNNFYATSPVCAPARRGFLTGRHVGNTGDFTNSARLQPNDWTVTKALSDAGYTVGAFGKWAVGDPGTAGLPWLHGVDRFAGELNQLLAHESFPHHAWDNDELWIFNDNAACQKWTFLPNRVKDKARSFIQNSANRPFFAFCPFTLPHANNEAGTIQIPWLNQYANKPWPDIEKRYAAAVTLLDTFVGQLVAAAPANTIVIFTADNGPHAAVGHDPDFFGSKGGLRGHKGWLYEGGVRVPTVIGGAGVSAGVSNYVGWLPDLAATICSQAGAYMPPNDGIDLSPLFSGGTPPDHDHLYWRFWDDNYWIHGEEQEAVRLGNWKGVRRDAANLELYDLTAGETVNVANSHPATVAEIEQIMLDAGG